MSSIQVHGFWEPEFNGVVDTFKGNFSSRSATQEQGAGFSLFHQGKRVVDIYAGAMDSHGKKPWQADTLTNVFSTTKGVAALCLAHLVEKGLMQYTDPVVKYWPEFAAKGKQDITIAHVLSHQSGLSGFALPTTLTDLLNWQACCEKLAAQAGFFPAATRTCYQAVTFGFLAGEIVRRITGCSLGAYLNKEICQPRNIDFFIGLPASQHGRVADLLQPTRAPYMPKNMPAHALAGMSNPLLRADFMMSKEAREAELPAVNGHGTASAIASLYELFHPDAGVLSHQTITQTTEVQSTRRDDLLGLPVNWAMGLVVNAGINTFGGQPSTFGHSGWGGSFGCHDPINQLSMGYVCNQMSPDLVGDARSTTLIEQVYKCLN